MSALNARIDMGGREAKVDECWRQSRAWGGLIAARKAAKRRNREGHISFSLRTQL